MTTSDPDRLIEGGYAVGYDPESGAFRVFGCLGGAVVLVFLWFISGHPAPLVLATLAAAAGYYYFPLVERKKARLGAGEYGVFLEGLGVIPWHAIGEVKHASYFVRTMKIDELHLVLTKALPKNLIADWRSLPWFRLLMKLPWSITQDNVVKVTLEPFGGKPQAVVESVRRQRQMYGGR
jgi:hypothetical protein